VTPAQPTTPEEVVVRELCAHLAGKSRPRLSPEDLDTTANVWLAGYVDSLSYVEFLTFIETQYGVSISDVDLTGPLVSIRGLASFICSKTRRS